MATDESRLRPRRLLWRMLRFRLSTLLIAMGVLGLALGWLGDKLLRVRQQRAAVADVKAAGGMVVYGYQARNEQPPGAPLLRWAFGDDLFANVEYVYFGQQGPLADESELLKLARLCELRFVSVADGEVSRKGLNYLERLPHLREFSIYNCTNIGPEDLRRFAHQMDLEVLTLGGGALSDGHVAAVSDVSSLRSLTLVRTPLSDKAIAATAELKGLSELRLLETTAVTDRGFAHLNSLHNLTNLEVVNTAITGESLQTIGAFGNLESLLLWGVQIDDENAQHLGRLHRLKVLRLNHTDFSDQGAAAISQLPQLRVLALTSTRISDSGMDHLSNLPRLESLLILGANISDRGLLMLADVKTLRGLDITIDGGITRQGVKRLQQVLPECEIQCWTSLPGGAYVAVPNFTDNNR